MHRGTNERITIDRLAHIRHLLACNTHKPTSLNTLADYWEPRDGIADSREPGNDLTDD
jgi:hypothetical protein